MKNINTAQIMGSTSVDKQGCQEVLLTYQIINQLQHEKATSQYHFQQSNIEANDTIIYKRYSCKSM